MLSKLKQSDALAVQACGLSTINSKKRAADLTQDGKDSNSLSDDIRRAIGGDSTAWNRLYVHYRPFLLSAARNQVSTADISHSDLVQEAWIRIYSGLHSFKGLDCDQLSYSFFVWLRKVARNAFLNIIVSREAKKRKPDGGNVVTSGNIQLADPASTPSSIVSRNEQEMIIRKALQNLDSDLDRQIIQLNIWEGHNLKAISKVIGMEYTRLRRRYQLILKKLQIDFETSQ